MKQSQQILHHLQSQGPLTALEALDLYGCARLAARIYDLRQQGHWINETKVKTRTGKTISQYSMSLVRDSLFDLQPLGRPE